MNKKPKILTTVSKTPLGVSEKLNVTENFFDQCKQCRNMKGHISFPKYGENKYSFPKYGEIKYIFTCEKFLTEEIPCRYYMPEKIFQSPPSPPLSQINRYIHMDMNEEEAKYCLLKSLSIINDDEYLFKKITQLDDMYGRTNNETNQQILIPILHEIQDHIKENYPFINVDIIK